MLSVGVYEAKTHLPDLLKKVASGETVTIENRGKPVARLVAAINDDAGRARSVIAAIKAARAAGAAGSVATINQATFGAYRSKGRK